MGKASGSWTIPQQPTTCGLVNLNPGWSNHKLFKVIIQLDGIPYNVGGFLANTTRGYLNRTDLALKTLPDTESFQVIFTSSISSHTKNLICLVRGPPSLRVAFNKK